MQTRSPLELDAKDWENLFGGLQPSFRVKQVQNGLYKSYVSPWENLTIPRTLRETFKELFYLSSDHAKVTLSDNGDTLKALLTLSDQRQIETVLMRYERRSTVCISTQVGCAMNCVFCATGQGGYERHLKVHEMQEQYFWAARELKRLDSNSKITNVVLMGMGEPLANYDNSISFVRSLMTQFSLGARSITLSTVGVVPGIVKLADESLQINLAVSLHAPNDELRTQIVPINRRYGIASLVEALNIYKSRTNRRITLEYALINDLNDHDEHMTQLADIALNLKAHVNLIPLNPTPKYDFRGSPPQRVNKCKTLLQDNGVQVTIRDTRGSDIAAACGQLVANNVNFPKRKRNASLV